MNENRFKLEPIEELFVKAGVASIEANAYMSTLHFKCKTCVMPTFYLSYEQVEKLKQVILSLRTTIQETSGEVEITGTNFYNGLGKNLKESIIDFLLQNWYASEKHLFSRLSLDVKNKVKQILENE